MCGKSSVAAAVAASSSKTSTVAAKPELAAGVMAHKINGKVFYFKLIASHYELDLAAVDENGTKIPSGLIAGIDKDGVLVRYGSVNEDSGVSLNSGSYIKKRKF